MSTRDLDRTGWCPPAAGVQTEPVQVGLSPPKNAWYASAGWASPHLDNRARSLRPNADVKWPVVAIEVETIEASVIEDPAGNFLGRSVREQKIYCCSQARADRFASAALEVRSNLPGNESRQRRACEAVRQLRTPECRRQWVDRNASQDSFCSGTLLTGTPRAAARFHVLLHSNNSRYVKVIP